MAFYELTYWGEDGNALEEDSLDGFVAALDGYVDAVENDENEDNDAFWDDFWGGDYYIYVDGQEYNPGDFVTAAYWASEVMGGNMSHWMKPGPTHTIDDLYQLRDYTESRRMFESILDHERGWSVEDEEVREMFDNPAVLGMGVLLEEVQNALYEGGITSAEAEPDRNSIRVWFDLDKHTPEEVSAALSKAGFDFEDIDTESGRGGTGHVYAGI